MKPLVNKNVITKEVYINVSLDLVWYAWTIPERVVEWFAPEAVIEPELGGAFELYFIPGNKNSMNTKGCKIIEIEEKSKLKFTWKAPDEFAELMNNEDQLTVVSIKIEEVEGTKTKVMLSHSGFHGDSKWNEVINWHKNAWQGVLDSLKAALEKGEGNLCCQPL